MATDPLTGLPQRDDLELAISDIRRKRINFGLIVIDLNGLKQINDRLGHQAGDDLIKKAANAIRSSIRAEDTAVRAGGDEFYVVLPGVTTRDLPMVKRGIASALAAVQVKASIGCACGGAGDDPQDLLARADEEMYQEKRRSKQQRPHLAAAITDFAVDELAVTYQFQQALPRDLGAIAGLLNRTGKPPFGLPEFYKAFPAGLWVIRSAHGVTGVVQYVPVSKDAAEALEVGKERKILPGMVDPTSIRLHVLFLTAANRQAAAVLMLRSVKLIGGKHGARITAFANSQDGQRVCERLGFRLLWNHAVAGRLWGRDV